MTRRSVETVRPSGIAQQLVSFVRGHLVHVILIIPGSLVFTLVHESAHALAVVLQGGTVTHFQWLPSETGWGHIRFTFPETATYSSGAVSLAPHILSLLLVFSAFLFAWRRRVLSDWSASFVYFWLFFAPISELGFEQLAWLLGGTNDVAKAFGPPNALSVAIVVVFGLAAYLLGYFLQARLYDKLTLEWATYSALAATTLLVMGGILYGLLSMRS